MKIKYRFFRFSPVGLAVLLTTIPPEVRPEQVFTANEGFQLTLADGWSPISQVDLFEISKKNPISFALPPIYGFYYIDSSSNILGRLLVTVDPRVYPKGIIEEFVRKARAGQLQADSLGSSDLDRKPLSEALAGLGGLDYDPERGLITIQQTNNVLAAFYTPVGAITLTLTANPAAGSIFHSLSEETIRSFKVVSSKMDGTADSGSDQRFARRIVSALIIGALISLIRFAWGRPSQTSHPEKLTARDFDGV